MVIPLSLSVVLVPLAADVDLDTIATVMLLVFAAGVECINTGARPRSDGEAGLRVVRVLDAGMRSLRAGGARVSYRQESESPEPARA